MRSPSSPPSLEDQIEGREMIDGHGHKRHREAKSYGDNEAKGSVGLPETPR
jgi:hypothetical protein